MSPAQAASSVASPQVSSVDLFEGVLRMADDALILSHRMTEWASWAPQLEEDMALANIALDLLGQARLLLTYAGELEGAGRDEDALAFLRPEREFRCVLLVEQPTVHHFDRLIAVLLTFGAWWVPMLQSLTRSSDVRLAEIAAKSVKEARYHLEHAAAWTIRLGDGTAYSRARMQQAVDEIWPLAGDVFEADEITERLVCAGVLPDPEAIRPAWDAAIDQVLAEATLVRPARGFRPGTGRRGVHSEHLGYLLAEMQSVHRMHPGAQW